MKINDKKLWTTYKTYRTHYLPTVRRQSINSILACQNSVDLFVDFIEKVYKTQFSQIDISFFSAEKIVAFGEWLEKDKHNLPTTINNRITCLKQFCKYLLKERVMDVIDYYDIQNIKWKIQY